MMRLMLYVGLLMAFVSCTVCENDERFKRQSYSSQRKLIISSIEEAPFLMVNKSGSQMFTGYCVDLAQKLSEMLNFSYEIRLVKEKRYGSLNSNGNWDGMMGELVRNEVDMVVAPLTISYNRQKYVSFSMPFMSVGISIMVKKPKIQSVSMFNFLYPFSGETWLCILLSYVGVSVILYLISRISPYEEQDENVDKLDTKFTLLNTLWFCLTSFMHQRIDRGPKSLSGRLAAAIWWFFVLVLVCYYISNLSKVTHDERMVSPIQSADDLVNQDDVQYGTIEGGSSQMFFKNSKVPTFKRMWLAMQSKNPSVFVKNTQEGVERVRNSQGKYAFLLESVTNQYLNGRLPCDTMRVGNDLDFKGYGVATNNNFHLKDSINLAILQLRDEGYLDELKSKWWNERSECDASSSTVSSSGGLNLRVFAGVFLILIIGLVLALLVAAIEFVYKKKLSK